MNLDAFTNARNKEIQDGMFNEANDLNGVADGESLLSSFTEMFEESVPFMPDVPGMSKNERTRVILQMMLATIGVTPDEYAEVYHTFRALAASEYGPMFGLGENQGKKGKKTRRSRRNNQGSGKTLILKIQMKGITKPPMWREISIPADFTFYQLHQAIQIVTGLTDSHLWQFNRESYMQGVQIGLEMDHNDPYGYGLDYITDDAKTTPLYKYLSEKGDKLEYVYDFGDDWIFTVKVQDVSDDSTSKVVCLKWKSDLNPMEDCGGPYTYAVFRDMITEDSGMTEKERENVFEQFGGWYESKEDMLQSLEDHKFNPDSVNSHLATI